MAIRGLRGRRYAFLAILSSIGLGSLALAPAASADTTRTVNLAYSCATGLPYGLEVNTGSGWYYPDGSSYAVGTTKYFTVYISASAGSFAFQPSFCDNQPQVNSYPMWEGYTYSITPGTSTINATGYTNDFEYDYSGYRYLFYYSSISSLSYS